MSITIDRQAEGLVVSSRGVERSDTPGMRRQFNLRFVNLFGSL